MSTKNLFLDEYITQMTDIVSKTTKKYDKKDIKKIVEKIVLDQLRDPEVTLDNNYIHRTTKTSLTSVFHYAMERKPILAGNGTFYKQHAESRNPISEMVDGFLDDRAALKTIMFANGDENSHEYKDLDLKQGNKKKLANSYYGGSGAPTSAFYSKYSGPATTLSAQSVISSTETVFEAFLADNFIFIDFNECFTWLEHILKEDFQLDDWVERVSLEDCVERVYSKLLYKSDEKKEILTNYISQLSEDEWTHIYYKNNLMEFTKRHEKVQKMHHKIFKNINVNHYQEVEVTKKGEFVNKEDIEMFIPKEMREEILSKRSPGKAWNSFVSVENFYDPNHVPDSIKKYIEEMNDVYMKYVYVQFLPLDKIYRLKNLKREVVTVIDTDSNILSLDTWMKYCQEELMESDYGRNAFDNIFIAINSITYIITSVVTDTLLYYGKCSNVSEEHRPRYAMKNEFFFSKLIIAKTKKRYLSKILLREGNRLTKPKYDVKGFDFKKATTAEEAEKVYMKIIKEELLNPEEISLKSLMNKLNGFKYEIKKSILHGERKYLPNANAKELAAYKDPSTNQGVRGVLAWNMLEPEKMIEFPAKVSLLKMNLETEEELEAMKEKYPDKYQIIKEGIFNDTSGIFIKPRKDSKTGNMVMKKIGMKVLAIPTNENIPEWALDFIDYSTIVNNILAPFKSVTEIFNLPGIEEGRTGRKSTGLSNIIKL